jgi:hypothetical protein
MIVENFWNYFLFFLSNKKALHLKGLKNPIFQGLKTITESMGETIPTGELYHN